MRLATALSILSLSFALHAQNFSERPVSALAYFHNNEEEQAAASDGTDFLVIASRGGTMLAHRVSAAGEVLDGAGIRIPTPRERLADFRLLGVFWGGDAYTIVWQILLPFDGPQPSPATPPDYRVQIVRIDREGRVIDGLRTVLSSRFPLFGAASNGTRIVLAGDRLTILDARGDLLESNLPLPSDFYSNLDHRVTWNGKAFMVAWAGRRVGEQSSYVNIAPLDADGRPLGTFKSIPAGLPLGLAIVSDGTDYVVVFKDTSTPTVDQTLHISAAGELLDRHALPGNFMTTRPAVVWSGSKYVVAAQAQDSKQLPSILRLDRSGASADPAPLSVSSTGAPSAPTPIVAASNGRQVLIAWREGTTFLGFRSFAQFLDSDGKPSSSPFAVGVTPTVQLSPRIAIGGGVFVVVWEEGWDVYASRLTLTGEALDGRGIKLSTTPAGGPRVVFDGQAYVIAWWTNTSILAARLAPDGMLTDQKTVLTNCNGDFDMTTDGMTVLVAARGCNDGLNVARLHRDSVAEPAVAVLPEHTIVDSIRVAWNGEKYLVLWRDLLPGIPTTLWGPTPLRGDVRGARLSASLALLDPKPLDIAVSQFDASAPLVASNGSDFLVAWTLAAPGTVRARTVKSDGTLGETAVVATEGITTSLVWDGRRYALAFTARNDLFVTHLGAGSPAAIAASGDPENAGVLAAAGNGALIAAYVRQASEAPYIDVPRVFVKGVIPQVRNRVIR